MMTINENETIFVVNVTVKTERFKDILISLLEGGNYWAAFNDLEVATEADKLDGEFNIIEQIMKGGKATVRDVENPDEILGELTLHKIKKAIQAMACGIDLKGKKNEHLKFHADNFFSENDDIETADVIIQIATMGEIVFG